MSYQKANYLEREPEDWLRVSDVIMPPGSWKVAMVTRSQSQSPGWAGHKVGLCCFSFLALERLPVHTRFLLRDGFEEIIFTGRFETSSWI